MIYQDILDESRENIESAIKVARKVIKDTGEGDIDVIKIAELVLEESHLEESRRQEMR